MKNATRDAEFNRDLARQMLALHEEKQKKKNALQEETKTS